MQIPIALIVVSYVGLGLAAVFLMLVLQGFRINQEWQRGVVYTLGRYTRVQGPGLFWIIPLLQSVQRVDVRILTVQLTRQETLTRPFELMRWSGTGWRTRRERSTPSPIHIWPCCRPPRPRCATR